MPTHVLNLPILTLELDELSFAQALGVRGVSRVGTSPARSARALLAQLTRQFQLAASGDQGSELPAMMHMHRLALPTLADIQALDISLQLLPPGRSARTSTSVTEKPSRAATTNLSPKLGWTTPATVLLNAFVYSEAPSEVTPGAGPGKPSERHHGLIPALNLHVLSESAQLLRDSLAEHARLWLMRKTARAQLRELALLARRHSEATQAIHLETLTLELPSAVAVEKKRVGAGSVSVVAEVAQAAALSGRHALELEAPLQRLCEALHGPAGGNTGRSVLLIAPSGAGKTALVRELAARAHAENVAPGSALAELAKRPIWHSTGARLVAGQSGFGMWQARCQALVRELAQTRGILHMASLSELMEVGRTRAGEQSIAGFLRQEIAHGALRMITECTPEQLQVIERQEPGLIAAFQVLEFAAPTEAQTAAIVQHYAAQALGAQRAMASAAALRWMQRLHRRYAGYAAHPARLLRFLGEQLHDFNAAMHVNPALASSQDAERGLDVASVTAAFQRESGLPMLLLDESMPFSFEAVQRWFSERISGQQAAIHTVVARIAQVKAQLHRGGRPLASVLLIGPTGSGKTELAKTLATFLFGSEKRLTRFDLSQLTDAASVQRLIGSQAFGDAEGLLTAKVREQPFCVLLLDEFEKAHPSFFDLLLQMLGDGRLTDGNGRVADFSNAVVLLTSNLGAAEAAKASMGFNVPQPTGRGAKAIGSFERAVQNFVRPELYNRFDAIVPFAPLDNAQIHSIARREVARIALREGLTARGIDMEVSPECVAHLARVGFNAQFGARALKRALEHSLSVPIARALSDWDARNAADAARGNDLRWILYASMDANAAAERVQIELRAVQNRSLPDAQVSQRLLVTRAQMQRRSAATLSQCPRVETLRDELNLLELKQRRLKKRAKSATDLNSVELARALALSGALTQLQTLNFKACALEDQLLGAFWQAQTSPRGLSDMPTAGASSIALSEQEQAQNSARATLFRLGFKQPDRVRFALYCEHADWLFELLCAYVGAAQQGNGTLTLLGVIERIEPKQLAKLARSDAAALSIKPTAELKKPEAVFERAQPGLLGVLLQADGPLFLALFSREFGLHSHKPEKTLGTERVALVEWAKANYTPRAELARSGTVASLALPRRRSFFHERAELVDSAMESNKIAWNLRVPRLEIPWLMQAALARTVSQFEIGSDTTSDFSHE
jgi:ATP-dependent Clp protease ATP-binding subunit ClpC